MKRILGSLLILLAMTLFSSCELLETTGSVIVQNRTSSTIIADVNDGDGNWQGERTIYSGSSYTYNEVGIGDVDGVARFSGSSTWYYSSTRTLEAGGTVTITWSPTKSATILNETVLNETVLYELVNGEFLKGSDTGRYLK